MAEIDILNGTAAPVNASSAGNPLHLASQRLPVSLELNEEHLSLWNAEIKEVVEPGVFEVMIGSSSKDIRLKSQFEVK